MKHIHDRLFLKWSLHSLFASSFSCPYPTMWVRHRMSYFSLQTYYASSLRSHPISRILFHTAHPKRFRTSPPHITVISSEVKRNICPCNNPKRMTNENFAKRHNDRDIDHIIYTISATTDYKSSIDRKTNCVILYCL